MELADEYRLKTLLKEAVIEAMEERRDEFLDIVQEVIEDIALSRAIDEGENAPNVSREEIFRILRDAE